MYEVRNEQAILEAIRAAEEAPIKPIRVRTTVETAPKATKKDPVPAPRTNVAIMPDHLLHFYVNDKYQMMSKPILEGDHLDTWSESGVWLKFMYEAPDLSYGPFRCCGARSLGGIDLNAGSLLTVKQQQEFVATWLRSVGGDALSWYFIASSSQMRLNANSEGRILNLLIKLGAKQIDTRPNYYHTPNQLHMFALSFRDNPNIEKFVRQAVTINRYGDKTTGWNPLWWHEQTQEQEQKLLDYYVEYKGLFSQWSKDREQAEKDRIKLKYRNDFYNAIAHSTKEELVEMVTYVKSAYGKSPEYNRIMDLPMLARLNEALNGK